MGMKRIKAEMRTLFRLTIDAKKVLSKKFPAKKSSRESIGKKEN
jgi:hypothetical protein